MQIHDRTLHSARAFTVALVKREREREKKKRSSLKDTSTYTDEEQAPWMRLGLSQGLPTATRILQHLHTVQVTTVSLKKRIGLDAKIHDQF